MKKEFVSLFFNESSPQYVTCPKYGFQFYVYAIRCCFWVRLKFVCSMILLFLVNFVTFEGNKAERPIL